MKSATYEETVKRLIDANTAGVKMAKVAKDAGVKWWKIQMLCAENPRSNPTLTDEECQALNSVLDEIKEALS